ncbi:MAG: tyrosine-type recombinase/integrase [Rhodobacteraceae bacterium]|nr:tyrosine-type recombinase/integrase [Paracoccaceae bacterium]
MKTYTTVRLTKSLIEKAEPQEEPYYLWDNKLPGFGCRIYPTGKKSYILSYRNEMGIQKRPVLGRFGISTLDDAREKACEWLILIATGCDPQENRIEERKRPSVKDFAESYITDYALIKKKPSSVRSDRSNLRLHVLPAIGYLRIDRVTRSHVQQLHNSMRNTPGAANHVLSLLSKIMNLAEKWGVRPDFSNPCRHIEKYKKKKLGRYIKPEEFKRLGETLRVIELEAIPMRSVDGAARIRMVQAIRLLILTGSRLGEILSLKWQYIDFINKVIMLPDSKTGKKIIYLSDAAISILNTITPLEGNSYVLPGRNGKGHLNRMGHLWLRIRREAEIEDLRLHDLRHGFASVGVCMGESLPIVGQLLGHTQAQTTARYAHLATTPMLTAANRIADRISQNLQPD